MITVSVGVATVAAVALVYEAVKRYVSYADRSLDDARLAWADIDHDVRAFLEARPPADVARLTIDLAWAGGCGCFVRGMLIQHYLPRLRPGPGKSETAAQEAYEALARADARVQAGFNRIVVRLIVYDSYCNPLQGLLLRRIIQSFSRPQPTWNDQLEAKMTAFSILSHRDRVAA